MKKSEIKNDLIVLKKLVDEVYSSNLEYAYDLVNFLKIENEQEFILYQIEIDELKKVTYEDVMSYARLLDFEYLYEISKLKEELSNNNKIIKFPKIN